MNEKKYTLKDKIMAMGPGLLIVGSFIGPGTVTSSTRAGANYGYDLLWCVVFSVVAVIIMQGMSARLGIVTQKGIPENLLKELKDRPFLKNFMVFLVAAAILLGGVAYMSGDLTGTALGLSALTGISTRWIAIGWGICILILNARDNAIKWLEKLLGVCVSVMALVFLITMFVVKPDWGAVFGGVIPSVPAGAMPFTLGGDHGITLPIVKELQNAKDFGATVITAMEVRENGWKAVITKALEVAAKDVDELYISICSDCLDAAFMPQGPQDMGGLTSYDMLMMLRECGKAGATGFDFVEIYPDAYSLQTASHVGCWFALYTLNGIAERKAKEGK